ncbi:MAG: SIS domain-containing protein [Deferribacteres bacterium]|nr:SIS domain-containing protein [candidate division KSB1 bacterium]MCB9501211.1 SIS domain-containing protein [Deferribacteres bacterium]
MNPFLTEIFEQPEALRDTLEFYTSTTGIQLLDDAYKLNQTYNKTRLLFTGMGSSYFAAYNSVCLLSNLGISSCLVNASELLHYNRSLLNNDVLPVFVSQSGESYEIAELLKCIPRNRACIGVTNETASALGKRARVTLLTKAGREEMTSTKTFVSTILVMLIFAWRMAGKWEEDKMQRALQVIYMFEALLDSAGQLLDSIMSFLGDFDFIELIGRGPAFPAAQQSALMFKEATRTAAEGILGGEFRHGPMEMVAEGFVSVIFAAKGKTFGQSLTMAMDIAKFGGKVLIITDSADAIQYSNLYVLRIPNADENYFSILSILPLQLIVNQHALNKGVEPGQFINGAKVTMIE